MSSARTSSVTVAAAVAAAVALAAAAVLMTSRAAAADDNLTALLRMQTQAMLDSVTAGDARVWDRYLHADAIYTAEDGVRKTKAQLLQEITPLPKGVSGTLAIVSFEVRQHGDTAIAVHDDHETEDYFGHPLTADYRTTDTWMRTRDGWRVVASQVHVRLSDPPAIRLSTTKLDEYAGTYRLASDITYAIRRDGESLIGERSGRPVQSLRVEASDVLFVPGQPRGRKVFLRDADGRITGFADRREGHDIVWTKER